MPQFHHNLPLEELTALTPLDGRYRMKIVPLATYFSEFSLIRTRIEIECAYLVALSQQGLIRKLTTLERKSLKSFVSKISRNEAEEIKQIENRIKHDVKAVEMYLRAKIGQTSLKDIVEMIHFGLTSEDINNLAYRLMLNKASENVLLPSLKKLLHKLIRMARKYKSTPMLARTHGQPAVPTTLGKELVVFASRLHKELKLLQNYIFEGKLSGAVGNFNAFSITTPKTDLISFAKSFTSALGLGYNPATTQINTYEDVIRFFQTIQRVNNILIDFDQDMWRYISDGWFIQEVKKEEIGSSTMPQKVNPISFENSEGNLGMANAMIEFFVRKLPISRLQRDLSDSTVIRNFGACLGYSLLGYESTNDGLVRVRPDIKRLEEDLMKDWSILAEAAQTILRKNNIHDAYTVLKNLTRGEQITENRWKEIVKSLPISQDIKESLLSLSPKKYFGLAPQIVEHVLLQMELKLTR